MTTFGVHSEVGRLRKVMVHRPELSLQRLTPTSHDTINLVSASIAVQVQVSPASCGAALARATFFCLA